MKNDPMGLFFTQKNLYDICMDSKIVLFQELADLFNRNGFRLFMVGGSVRDYLLRLPLTDMDLVTDATPEQEKNFLDNADYTFERFGSIKLFYKDVKFDITTLRKENNYVDARHPNRIEFTDKLDVDVLRRDLTINALYLSKELEVLDFIGGQRDLEKHIIKMIGDPLKRIQEDPLRIVRIYRFKYDLGFEIDEGLVGVIEQNYQYDLVSINKILKELRLVCPFRVCI